jgi:hypothetical protein
VSTIRHSGPRSVADVASQCCSQRTGHESARSPLGTPTTAPWLSWSTFDCRAVTRTLPATNSSRPCRARRAPTAAAPRRSRPAAPVAHVGHALRIEVGDELTQQIAGQADDMYAPVLARYVLVAGFPAFLKVLRDRKFGPSLSSSAANCCTSSRGTNSAAATERSTSSTEHTFDRAGHIGRVAVFPRDRGCACEVTDDIGRPVGYCDRPPTRRATWTFADDTARILLCDEHAAELAGHERLTLDSSPGATA